MKSRKSTKMLLSILLSVSMAVGGIMPAFAAPKTEDEPGGLNPLVAVIEKVTSGDELNLTEEGTLDWVHIAGQEINRKKGAAEIIKFENLTGEDVQPVGDSPMLYTWTDGTVQESVTKAPKSGAFLYKKGDTSSVGMPIEGNTYKISLPAAEETRMLTFVSGIWEATATFRICVNGETTPVYTTELKASGEAPVKKYTLVIREHNSVEVTATLTEKTNKDGNMSLGGITLKSAEPSPISVKVKDVSSQPKMNLTEMGDEDWMHFEGEVGAHEQGKGVIAHKADVEPKITYDKLSQDGTTTMHDAPIEYSWSDGVSPDNAVKASTTGAVFTYKNGEEDSTGKPIEEDAGYKMTIASADYDRELVFVSGVWNADAEISINLDGESKPIYENKELQAGGNAVNKIYQVSIAEGKGLTVTGKIKKKSHSYGNFNLQAATLSKNQTLNDYKTQLEEVLRQAKELNLGDYEEFYTSQLESEIAYAESVISGGQATNSECYVAYLFLNQAYESCLKSELDGQYMFESNRGLTSSFGWEGDKHAPIAYLDGSYRLRDNANTMVTFGVRDIPGKVKWYNAEGYLPCFVSEYSKGGMDYKIENFANKHTIDGQDFEIAYSRMTVTNNTEEEQRLPKVSGQLIPLNDDAKTAKTAAAGETVVRDYAIGADRFGGDYAYPAAEALAAQGGFDDNYTAMKEYWNARLEPLSAITSLPNEDLINAYKAGFIYTLILRDDVEGQKRLHVGENGYDEMFDHDTIGIVATLLTMGDFTYAKEYLATLPAQLQYDDAKWKYSWPYALYLQKTDDFEFIESQFETIKTNTHNVDTDRDMDAGGIIKKTNAIDSNGYWLIDNWAALAGLTTYQYLCERLNEQTPDEKYTTEISWAKELYRELLECVETKQRQMREANDYPYLSIDMNVTTENSARGDVRDGNWASMFLFGRWAWDGYLFGADQENSEMIGLIDDTYQHGFERREEVSDTIYNFGGYPHGYYSSAYNAGYGSSALRGERYREAGIRAYEFMIDKAMSGPFGWWEGVDYPDDNSPWAIAHAKGGGGSCQHMWGQSTATKVLYDALIAEKLGEKVIIGRGIPKEWTAEGQAPVEIKDYTVEGAKKVGYKMTTTGKQVEIAFTGDTLEVPYSVELISLKNNISKVMADGKEQTENINEEAGTVLAPAGTKKVVITMTEAVAGTVDKSELEQAVREAEAIDLSKYTAESAGRFQEALISAKAVMADASATQQQVDGALNDLKSAEDRLVLKNDNNGDNDNNDNNNNDNNDNNNNDNNNNNNNNNSNGNNNNSSDNNNNSSNNNANKPVKVTKIKLSGISTKIAAGKKITLKAQILPANASNKKVTWSTSNKKYATVNSKGVVTMKKKGAGKTVTITARAKDGSGKKASIKIKIMKGVVKKVKLKASAKSVKAGKKVTLKATVTASKGANKTLAYSVSNKKYASVSKKGVVTAKKAGRGKTVTVTAKATDGSNKKASVKIKITK